MTTTDNLSPDRSGYRDRIWQPADRGEPDGRGGRRHTRLPPVRQQPDGRSPVLCLQHFRGNLDFWDPTLVDRIAQDREVILLANAASARRAGSCPTTWPTWPATSSSSPTPSSSGPVDVLGFSLGGHIAQELALLRPRMVRRIVLAGTGPQGGPNLHRWSDDVYAHAAPTRSTPSTPSTCSSPARRRAGPKAWPTWSGPDSDRPTATNQPTWPPETPSWLRSPPGGSPTPPSSTAWPDHRATFVAVGDNDTMMPPRTANFSPTCSPTPTCESTRTPTHGFLNQYPELFADHVRAFLNAL